MVYNGDYIRCLENDIGKSRVSDTLCSSSVVILAQGFVYSSARYGAGLDTSASPWGVNWYDLIFM